MRPMLMSCPTPMRQRAAFGGLGGVRLVLRVLVLFLVCVWWEHRARAATVNLQSSGASTHLRWEDTSNQLYATTYSDNFDYASNTDSGVGATSVSVTFADTGTQFSCTLNATNLKPNFAYQLKLDGGPASAAANENLGYAGRWWREEWNGTGWANGQNLNIQPPVANADDYPNTKSLNDEQYDKEKVLLYEDSTTQLRYKFTGYLLMGYFITDASGGVSNQAFTLDNSYHVLWKDGSNQEGYRPHTDSDGPLLEADLNEPTDYTSLAYTGTSYGNTELDIFGEWERLPQDGISLPEDTYTVNLRLTEESFHTPWDSSGNDTGGYWATVMDSDITFSVVPEPSSALLALSAIGLLSLRRRRATP